MSDFPRAQQHDDLLSQRDRLAELLDNLVQEVSMGTQTLSRKPTYDTFAHLPFSDRLVRLEADALAAILLIKTKNARAKARARQRTKRRGITPRGK